MRCCASPTISIAADVRERAEDAALRARRDDTTLRARDVMNAVLFREILKPLARGLGPLGEIAIGEVADDLFVRRVR